MSAASVVKQVFVEFKTMGTAHVSAEIERTEQQAKKSGRATEAFGKNYGMAARQIASATETIARSGKVTAEAGKQIVGQASNIAFAFGAGGAAVGALGIFGLAVVQMWKRGERAAREARQEFEKTLRVISGGRDYAAAGGLVARTLAGDAGADDEGRRLGLARIGGEIDRVRADITARSAGFGTDRDSRVALDVALRPARARLALLEATRDALKQEYDDAQEAFNAIAALEQERLKNLKKIAADEKATDEARAEAKRQLADAEREAAQAREEFQRNAAAFGKDFDALVLRELGNTADQVAASFDALLARGKEFGASPEQLAQIEALRDRAVSAAVAIADVDALLQRMDIAAAQGVEPTVESFVALTAAADRLRAELAQLNPETEAYRRILAEIEKIEKRRTDLMKGVANTGGKTTSEDVRTTADLAREIQQAADGALQLAQNFAGADASAIGLLRTVAQIAGNLPALQGALKSGSGLGVIGAALPILGALSSLFGSDPAEEARRQVIQENTDAIRELTKQAGLIGLGVAGSAATGAGADLTRFLTESIDARRLAAGIPGGRNARDAARAFGLDLAELDEIARAHGITLNGSIESFRQLQEAIGLTITKLGEFGTDLESQLQQARATAQVFGITDPLELLGLTQGAYGGRSPVLDQALGGLDLSTAEGRAAARVALQDLFRVMQAGGGTLGADQLGGLTGDQLLQAILDLIKGLNDVDESLGLNTSTVGNPDRVITADRTQITADQASRLLGIQTSALSELRIIREALTAAGTPLSFPSLPRGFASTGGTGGATLVINQYIEVASGGARETAAASADALADVLDRTLGIRLRIQQLHTGKAVRS